MHCLRALPTGMQQAAQHSVAGQLRQVVALARGYSALQSSQAMQHTRARRARPPRPAPGAAAGGARGRARGARGGPGGRGAAAAPGRARGLRRARPAGLLRPPALALPPSDAARDVRLVRCAGPGAHDVPGAARVWRSLCCDTHALLRRHTFPASCPGTRQRNQCPCGSGARRTRKSMCHRQMRCLQCGGRCRMVHGLLEGAAGELFVRRAEPGADAPAGAQPSAEDVAAAEWHRGFYVRALAPQRRLLPPRTLGHTLQAVLGSSCICQGLPCACACTCILPIDPAMCGPASVFARTHAQHGAGGGGGRAARHLDGDRRGGALRRQGRARAATAGCARPVREAAPALHGAASGRGRGGHRLRAWRRAGRWPCRDGRALERPGCGGGATGLGCRSAAAGSGAVLQRAGL